MDHCADVRFFHGLLLYPSAQKWLPYSELSVWADNARDDRQVQQPMESDKHHLKLINGTEADQVYNWSTRYAADLAGRKCIGYLKYYYNIGYWYFIISSWSASQERIDASTFIGCYRWDKQQQKFERFYFWKKSAVQLGRPIRPFFWLRENSHLLGLADYFWEIIGWSADKIQKGVSCRHVELIPSDSRGADQLLRITEATVHASNKFALC